MYTHIHRSFKYLAWPFCPFRTCVRSHKHWHSPSVCPVPPPGALSTGTAPLSSTPAQIPNPLLASQVSPPRSLPANTHTTHTRFGEDSDAKTLQQVAPGTWAVTHGPAVGVEAHTYLTHAGPPHQLVGNTHCSQPVGKSSKLHIKVSRN